MGEVANFSVSHIQHYRSGLCRDHTIAKGLSLKFAIRFRVGSAVGGAPILLRRSRCITHGFTAEKALYTGSTWG